MRVDLRPSTCAVRRLVCLVVATLVLAGCSGSDSKDVPEPVDGPLSILLVNDDGWDAPGITAVYDALRAAGHDVTLVAPLENQSGRSMATNVDALAVTRPEPGSPKYAVDGTPVDALNVGLFGVLDDKRPDVVVSGINLGANVGANVNYSGTFGAATAAAEAGVPAFAVSADVDADGVADFDDATQVTVRLVEAYARRGFDGMGRRGVINVNVPFEVAGRDRPRGVVAAPLADGGPRSVVYRDTGGDTWTPEFAYDPRVGGRAADAERLADGYVTVTALSVARQTYRSEEDVLTDLVDGADLLRR